MCFRSAVRIHWLGFEDEQSGIHHYTVCLSTGNGHCNVYVKEGIYGNEAILSNISLIDGETYTAQVTACNKVHLCSAGISQPFTIDITPPEVVTNIHLTSTNSLAPNTQFDGSYVSFAWKMTDDKIPLTLYTLSLTSHHDGEIPLNNLVLGDITSTTIALPQSDRLRDGYRYSGKVIGCNAAHLCTVSETNSFLVDSSPPLLGGFVEPMKWSSNASGTTLDIAWEGFSDPHSNVKKYYITVSSGYNGFDLSNGVFEVKHDKLAYTQRSSLLLQDIKLEMNSKIYLSIWAENNVGLASDAGKVSVLVLRHGKDFGRLEIEKHGCEVHYCNNDCTCAVVNQKCTPSDISEPCVELNATDTDALLVYDGIYDSPTVLTPSTACLPGFWISNYSSPEVTRYEWSVSMFGQEAGEGIFDIINEKIWFDIEMYDRAVFCLPNDQSLIQAQRYIYHVRAWHDQNSYTIYKSPGVLIDSTPPVINLGSLVKDTDPDFSGEIDFTDRSRGIYAEWRDVFSDAECGIVQYYVAVGVTSGGKYTIFVAKQYIHVSIKMIKVSYSFMIN